MLVMLASIIIIQTAAANSHLPNVGNIQRSIVYIIFRLLTKALPRIVWLENDTIAAPAPGGRPQVTAEWTPIRSQGCHRARLKVGCAASWEHLRHMGQWLRLAYISSNPLLSGRVFYFKTFSLLKLR